MLLKTQSVRGALALIALAAGLGAAPVHAADSGAIPIEQSAEQTQTLMGTQSNFYRMLESWSTMPVMEISRRIGQDIDKEPSHLSLALTWAKDKVSVKDFSKVNSLYFLIYADMAERSALNVPPRSPYYMAYSKAAYQALTTFEVMFMTDAARCVNPNANASAAALLPPRYAALKYVFDSASPSEMDSYWDTALHYEAAAGSRPGNGEICSNGVAEALAVEAGQTPPERLDASFVDDAKWAPLRDKVRAGLAVKWRTAYAPAARAWQANKARADAAQAQAAAAERQKAAAAAAAKQAVDAAAVARQKATEEQVAKEKQERLDAQKREAGKYHDSYVPEPSTEYEDSGGSGD